MSPLTHQSPALDTVKNRENFNGIDLVKFLCAILVFTIHIAPFRRYSLDITLQLNAGLQRCFCRIAVPFYFMASGFFLFRNTDLYGLTGHAVKDYCFKRIRLIGLWSILLFVGGNGHLWYLCASVVAVLLLFLCLRLRIKLGYLYVLALILYLFGLLGDSYYGFLEPLKHIRIFHYAISGYEFFFQQTRNGVFMGFIFVLMGATFACYKIKLPPGVALLGFFISILCLFAEAFTLAYYSIPRDYNMYVFLLPSVFFLFYLARNAPLPDSFIYRNLRIISVLIYFLHELINQVAILGVHFFKRITGIRLSPYQYIVSLGITIAVAVLLTYLSRKEKFRWLRWLYS